MPLHGLCLPMLQELFQQHALERAMLQKECCASEEALQSQRRHSEHHLLSASLTDRITDELWGGLAGSWQQFRSTGGSQISAYPCSLPSYGQAACRACQTLLQHGFARLQTSHCALACMAWQPFRLARASQL